MMSHFLSLLTCGQLQLEEVEAGDEVRPLVSSDGSKTLHPESTRTDSSCARSSSCRNTNNFPSRGAVGAARKSNIYANAYSLGTRC